MVLMVLMVLISGPGAAETLSGRRQSLVEQVKKHKKPIFELGLCGRILPLQVGGPL